MTSAQQPAGPSADDDPTGMRALLSSLPEPGPMPAHLVHRITASLAEEQAQRARRSDAVGDVARAVPLRERRRFGLPRIIPALGAAAAAVAIFALGVSLAQQTVGGSGDSAESAGSAAIGGAAGGAASGAASGAADGTGRDDAVRSGAPAASTVPPTVGDLAGAGATAVIASGRSYTAAGLAAQLRQSFLGLLDAPGTPTGAATPGAGGPPQAVPSPVPAGYGALSTSAGLRACLGALGVAGADGVVVDLARYQGAPAAVVLVTRGDARTAHVVAPSCSAAGAAQITSTTVP